MNGENIADLEAQFQSNKVLSNANLKELHEGYTFLYQYFRRSKLGPLAVYYGMQMEATERMIESRKQNRVLTHQHDNS